ncbi:MAG: DUF6175 family protein [Bacteroidota bacterium]
MKRFLFTIILMIMAYFAGYSQAKKPTIMVVPSDNYCIERGYVSTMDVQGKIHEFPDYKAAMQYDSQLRMVITKLGSLMVERGFPLQDLEQGLKNLNSREAEQMMLTSETTGSGIFESPVDRLKRTARADIIMDIDFDVKNQGPEKYIVFNLRGLDSYTGKQIAGAAGTGEPSMAASADLLIEEAVLSHMDQFNGQLMDFFSEMFEKGREVSINLYIWEDAVISFQDEFDFQGIYDELGFHIEDWLAENTVEGRFTTSVATNSNMSFTQVRIPLYFERRGIERAMDTRRYVNQLRSFLRNDPFNIESKIYQRGLGEAWLILGDK